MIIRFLIQRLDNPDEILKSLEVKDNSILCLKSKLDNTDEPIEIITAEIDESESLDKDENLDDENKSYYKYQIIALLLSH